MMNVNSNIPQIRFSGFSEPWEQCKLGDVFEEYSEKGHPELPALTIIQGGGTIRRDESDRSLQYDKASLSNYKMVNEGDFIVHLRSFEGGLEMATTIGIISPAYHTFHGEGTDSRFFYSYFRSPKFIDQDLKPHVYGIRDGRSIDIEGMKTIEIPWTNLVEQKAIGDYIECLDDLITLHQRKYEELKQIKNSMLDKMFPRGDSNVPEIRFTGFNDPWEQRKVGNFTNVLSASRVHKDEWQTEGVPFYRSSDVVSAYKGADNERAFISRSLYEELIKSSGKLEQGDILITGGGSIGIPYIVPNNEPLYSKDADLIWIKKSVFHDSGYLYTYFTSQGFRDYIGSISHVGTIAHYTIEQVKDTPVLLPKMDEQKAIGSFFGNLDTLITLHQRKYEKLKQIKKFMLKMMFV